MLVHWFEKSLWLLTFMSLSFWAGCFFCFAIVFHEKWTDTSESDENECKDNQTLPWHGKHFFTSGSAISLSTFLAWQTLIGTSCSLSISVTVHGQNKSENWNSCKWKSVKNPYNCYLSEMAAAFCPEKQCVSLNPFLLASLEHIPKGLALSND